MCEMLGATAKHLGTHSSYSLGAPGYRAPVRQQP